MSSAALLFGLVGLFLVAPLAGIGWGVLAGAAGVLLGSRLEQP